MAKRKAAKRAVVKKAQKKAPKKAVKKAVRKAVKKPARTSPKQAHPVRNTAKRRPEKATRRSAKPKAKASAKKKVRQSRATQRELPPSKVPRLDRERRTLDETLRTPPSSLDMVRKGTAARSGRAEMEQSARDHRGMSPDITGGDVDVDVEDAYFTGDGAPGGDNPSPDLEVVDDIGKALGVRYADDEELKGAPKIEERDKHRWEMDPASAEDYKDRD
jgi:hypothetical protein